MKTILFSFLLIFSVGCFALPECSGSPKEISDYTEVENWSNCKGEITFASNGGHRAGNSYVGAFKNGKIHGQGTYTWNSGPNKGAKYVGESKDGKSNGQGIRTFADGNKYVGEFKDNNAHGQGTFIFVDGYKLVGEWKNNEYLGELQKAASDKQIINIDIKTAKTQCEELGFKPKTEKFGECVLKLVEMRKPEGEQVSNPTLDRQREALRDRQRELEERRLIRQREFEERQRELLELQIKRQKNLERDRKYDQAIDVLKSIQNNLPN